MPLRLSNILLIAAIIMGVIFLSGLGTWQLQRLAWKEGLIERVKNNLSAPPVPLTEIESLQEDGADIEYRPVQLSATFDHGREQHFFATHKSNPGYFVYTPATLSDGRVLFVNRGYVPLQRKAADGRAEGQVAGQVDIVGLARTAPTAKPNSFVPENDLAKNVYHWKSLTQMTTQAFPEGGVTTLPFFVDANDSPNPGGLPQGGVTLIQFPNSHLHYALTWFGLAGALLVVGGYFLFGRLRQKSSL
ncbi:MAG: SURF1 family protein [Rhizobiaceae bacterium]